MSGIVVPTRYGRFWRRLIATRQHQKAIDMIRTAVDASYVTHPMRNPTATEDERRIRICADYIETVTHEHRPRYSLQRALDTVVMHLQKKLNTEKTDPSKSRTWWAHDQTIL